MVSEHGSLLKLDRQCVLIIHACQFYVCFLHLLSMFLLHFLDVDHDGSKVVMRNLMIYFLECIIMSI